MYKASSCSTFSPNTVFSEFFFLLLLLLIVVIYNLQMDVEMVSQCGFDLHFPNGS